MLSIVIFLGATLNASNASDLDLHYPLLNDLIKEKVSLEYSLGREARARALYGRRYGIFGSLDHREWDEIHDDFKLQIAREEAMDHEIDRRVRKWTDQRVERLRPLRHSTVRLIATLVTTFDLPPRRAEKFRRHAHYVAQSLPNPTSDGVNASLALDAEMLARTFERLVNAPSSDVLRTHRRQAATILIHAYGTMGQGREDDWVHALFDSIARLSPTRAYHAKFWSTVRRALTATRPGQVLTEFDDDSFAPDAMPRSSQDPEVIADRVITGLGGRLMRFACDELLDPAHSRRRLAVLHDWNR